MSKVSAGVAVVITAAVLLDALRAVLAEMEMADPDTGAVEAVDEVVTFAEAGVRSAERGLVIRMTDGRAYAVPWAGRPPCWPAPQG